MATEDPDSVDALRMHDPRVADAHKRMVDLEGLTEADIAHAVQVMNAVRDWREAENRMSEASRGYMKLGDNDMRALRYIIIMVDRGEPATARGIARHLGISSAATTKLLDRLEAAGHIRRTPHPTDRRALAVVRVCPRRLLAHVDLGVRVGVEVCPLGDTAEGDLVQLG